MEELKADFGDYPRDKDGNVNMHRPWIDNLTRVNLDDPTGKSHMHRISDVLDCWFESGSMSFAQFHYPFENKEKFEHFPADYIVEYIGQTRGWFYLLHVMATAPFDRPGVQERDLPRHRARFRRPEDVEAPAQLPGRERRVRQVRFRRHALVPYVVADPARRQPHCYR